MAEGYANLQQKMWEKVGKQVNKQQLKNYWEHCRRFSIWTWLESLPPDWGLTPTPSPSTPTPNGGIPWNGGGRVLGHSRMDHCSSFLSIMQCFKDGLSSATALLSLELSLP